MNLKLEFNNLQILNAQDIDTSKAIVEVENNKLAGSESYITFKVSRNDLEKEGYFKPRESFINLDLNKRQAQYLLGFLQSFVSE